MSAPQTTRSWSVTGTTGFDDVKWNEDARLPAVGDHDVLVRFHAASLNYRDLIIPKVCHVLTHA